MEIVTRREMLRHSSLGLGAAALAALLRDDGLLGPAANAADHLPGIAPSLDDGPKPPHHTAAAEHVVYLFLGGGPGHVDTFDPKPELTRLHGQNVPDSIAAGVPQIARAPLHNLLASPWKFQKSGDSGLEISELFPFLAACADDLCVLRGCRHDSPIHAPAEYLTTTGSLLGDRPSLGAWLTYGLGSENRDLPGFVVFRTGETSRPPTTAAGFLPSRFQGITVDVERGVPHLARPANVSPMQRRAQLDFLNQMNRRRLGQLPETSELEARIASYELGFRMQVTAPEAFDLSRETAETQRLYGIGDEETNEYGRILLLTRRLIERGVRCIQLRSGGWDAHSDLLGNHTKKCRATDRPIAAFLQDLKRRGLLSRTLVIWGGEFGRTPTAQPGTDKPGRDHSPSGYSMWLAGGGVRGGQVIGATDPVGYAAIERPVHPHDLHATLLHALGLDQHRLYYLRNNRRELVTVNGGEVIREVFG